MGEKTNHLLWPPAAEPTAVSREDGLGIRVREKAEQDGRRENDGREHGEGEVVFVVAKAEALQGKPHRGNIDVEHAEYIEELSHLGRKLDLIDLADARHDLIEGDDLLDFCAERQARRRVGAKGGLRLPTPARDGSTHPGLVLAQPAEAKACSAVGFVASSVATRPQTRAGLPRRPVRPRAARIRLLRRASTPTRPSYSSASRRGSCRASNTPPLDLACTGPLRHPRRRRNQSYRRSLGNGASRPKRWTCGSTR
eukprot:scaffold14485_cov67-Phaeocystis_antarctica.AAC.6